MNWIIYGLGAISGGSVYKLIDYLIAWSKERREQKAAKTTHEKDRPRFRVDVVVTKPAHPMRPTIVVKILSLGSLPVTINQGNVVIEAGQYPACQPPQDLSGRVVTPNAPIETEFPFTIDIMHPQRREEFSVKVLCKFSYDGNRHYEWESIFNSQTDRFEDGIVCEWEEKPHNVLNLKRGFNRIFIVLTVVWVLGCAFWPLMERDTFANRWTTIYIREEVECQTSACKQEAQNNQDRVWRENSVRTWYGMYVWDVLLLAAGGPIIFYGAARGTASMGLWIGRGFKR